MNKINLLSGAIILLIAFQIVFIGYMAYNDLHVRDICVLGRSCEQVRDTQYGQIFGIKLPFIAIFAFGALLLCYFFIYKLFIVGNFLGLIVSLILIYIQAFILKMFCINCLIVDITMLLIFSLSLLEFLIKKRHQFNSPHNLY